MKILISTSKEIYGDRYFSSEALAKATTQNSGSRDTLVYLQPSDFLALCKPGLDSEKQEGVSNLLRKGVLFESLPYLGVETLENGDLQVSSNGADHEGRHRVRALQRLGVSRVPVIIASSSRGEGDCYRWGETRKRPRLLIGYSGFSINFPKTETYK